MENKSLKIGVLGLGLIGGSILKKLHSLGKYYLIASSKSSYMKAKQYADITSFDTDVLAMADVVFVCSRMEDTISKLNELNKILDKKTVVADVCSIKGFLPSNYNFNFIQTHPMAGVEFFGFESSRAELFEGAKWIISKENDLLLEIIKELGANPVLMNSKTHDKLTAQISHLPSILAIALFNSVCDDAKKIAAGGFYDMTRLAMQDSSLTYDMLNLNRENVEAAFNSLVESFNKIKDLDEKEFKILASEIAKKREQMYNSARKNIL